MWMFNVNMNGITACQVDSRLLLQEYGLSYNILGHAVTMKVDMLKSDTTTAIPRLTSDPASEFFG